MPTPLSHTCFVCAPPVQQETGEILQLPAYAGQDTCTRIQSLQRHHAAGPESSQTDLDPGLHWCPALCSEPSSNLILPAGKGEAHARAWPGSKARSRGVQDNVSEHPERFFVGEIIREKIIELYHDEIPYAATVRRSQTMLACRFAREHPSRHTHWLIKV